MAVIVKIRFWYFCAIYDFVSYAVAFDWSLAMFRSLVTNLESFTSFNKFSIFSSFIEFHCITSVTINKSKEKFKILFCCFLAKKNIAAPSFSSNFPANLIYWGIELFVCFNKPISMSL